MNTKRFSALCLIALMAGFLSGCIIKEDDFISKYCPGSCTVIKGRMTTGNGAAPLAGVQLLIQWNKEVYLSGATYRKKAVATTDAGGNYELRFLLRDEELEDGYFQVIASVDQSRYFICGATQTILTFYNLSRDTTLEENFNFPYNAFIELQLQNKEAIGADERFMTHFQMERCASAAYWSADSPATQVIPVAADESVIITNRNNGVEVSRPDTLVLSPGQKIVYKVAF